MVGWCSMGTFNDPWKMWNNVRLPNIKPRLPWRLYLAAGWRSGPIELDQNHLGAHLPCAGSPWDGQDLMNMWRKKKRSKHEESVIFWAIIIIIIIIIIILVIIIIIIIIIIITYHIISYHIIFFFIFLSTSTAVFSQLVVSARPRSPAKEPPPTWKRSKAQATWAEANHTRMLRESLSISSTESMHTHVLRFLAISIYLHCFCPQLDPRIRSVAGELS